MLTKLRHQLTLAATTVRIKVSKLLGTRNRIAFSVAVLLAIIILVLSFLPAERSVTDSGVASQQSILQKTINTIKNTPPPELPPPVKSTKSHTTDSSEKIEEQRGRLNTLVAQKELTKAQAAAIDAKLVETLQFYKDNSAKPEAELRKLIDAKQAELQEWAIDNDINPVYVRI